MKKITIQTESFHCSLCKQPKACNCQDELEQLENKKTTEETFNSDHLRANIYLSIWTLAEMNYDRMSKADRVNLEQALNWLMQACIIMDEKYRAFLRHSIKSTYRFVSKDELKTYMLWRLENEN